MKCRFVCVTKTEHVNRTGDPNLANWTIHFVPVSEGNEQSAYGRNTPVGSLEITVVKRAADRFTPGKYYELKFLKAKGEEDVSSEKPSE